MKYCKNLFLEGKWDTFVPYIVNFIGKNSVDEHKVLFFEILKQKLLDYLDQCVTKIYYYDVTYFKRQFGDGNKSTQRRDQTILSTL
jgi:hypothetical protein